MKKNRTLDEIKQPKKMTSIGGQALMEGLMMIGPVNMAMAVRLPDGQIHVETALIGKSSKAAKIPFIRGSVKIFRQMVTGTRYLMRSASFIEEDIRNDDISENEKLPTEINSANSMQNEIEGMNHGVESEIHEFDSSDMPEIRTENDSIVEDNSSTRNSNDNISNDSISNDNISNDNINNVSFNNNNNNNNNNSSNSSISSDNNNNNSNNKNKNNDKNSNTSNNAIHEESADSLLTETFETMDIASMSIIGKNSKKQHKKKEKENKGPGKIEQYLMKHTEVLLYLSAIFGIFLSVGLFILLPNLITNLTVGLFIDKNLNITNRVIYSLVEGVLRITIFIVYLAFASKLKEIRRVWMYHGAEHKTIACYESGLPLTIENARSFSKHHPRCGTAFMFIILIISIIIFSFVPKINIIVDLLIRLACVPLLASLSYEVIHWAARHDNPFTRGLSWPGLMLQRLTTKEPDDDMLEVAIAAMIPVIPAGERGDEW